MSLPYRKYARYILSDLAKRIQSNGPDCVVFRGNHVSRQYQIPVQAENESATDFKRRLVKFRKGIARDSDQSFRLALAVEALRKAGEKSWAAADIVREMLDRSMRESAVERRQYQQMGIPWMRVRFNLGKTQRSRRKARKRRLHSPDLRVTETIRSLVNRYKRNHPDFQATFDFEFQSFRSEFHRDREWYIEAEPVYRERMLRAERELGRETELVARHTVIYARILHEQGKFAEAEPVYRLALGRWREAPVPEDLRAVAVRGIENEIQNCLTGRGPDPLPVYIPPVA